MQYAEFAKWFFGTVISVLLMLSSWLVSEKIQRIEKKLDIIDDFSVSINSIERRVYGLEIQFDYYNKVYKDKEKVSKKR